MRYLVNTLRGNKDYLVVFIVFFFLAFPYVIDICSGYLNHYNFDLQEFLLWHYTSINNLIPYRDIFYPYGLFNYFKNYSLTFTFVYYLIVPLLFTFLFFIFKKVFKDKLILYFSFIFFYVFVLTVVGFQTFSRYGLLTIISLFFSYIFYSNKKVKIATLIGCGAVLGLFFSFINDQGVYLVLSFIFLFMFSKFIQVKKISIKEFTFVAFGFFIGVIPIFLFLQYVSNFYVFFDFFKNIKEITIVAKTPFFSFIDSPANIFTIMILYFAIFYNFLKLFFFKRKFTISSFFQMSLIFSILIMEYKSIIRSVDRQIVFISLILLMLLLYEIINYFKNNIVNKRIVYVLLIFIATILYSLNVDKQIIDFPHLSENLKFLLSNKCYENNLKFFLDKNPSYTEIIKVIKRQKNFNGKIFSFPTGDSVFYVLLNQKPPFYNSIFEGASYDKQNSAIKYIQDNKIEFVTLNTSKSSLQDGVPDYIRQGFLFKYILNNYYPFSVIGNHIMLKKESRDFFISKLTKKKKDYLNYLLNVYMYKIPYSEGLYKYNLLKKNNKLIIESNNVDVINSFLEKKAFYSDNKVVVLIPSIEYKAQSLSFIKFQLENEDYTTVYYNSCKENEACIFNLSKIPLFYKERLVAKFILDKGFTGKIKIFELKHPSNLW